MSDDSFRMQRIEKLFKELEYELARGFCEGEINESITWQHIFPVSKECPSGVVSLRFQTRPVHRDSVLGRELNLGPKLKLVK